ncbi:hypothetical protein B0H10DRAFT_1985369 [Mycena sp. CBHHK59/15]|nr:hypothetical protein B0H10DRAFT_1985369 [Mycena sp. CBHHK59/15]
MRSAPLMLSTLMLVLRAAHTAGSITPLFDTSSSTASVFFVTATSSAADPSTCIDTCFDNATGGGTQGGCVGISGQYACICSFPEFMNTFTECMRTTCALDQTTVQQTLDNVQQVCAGCEDGVCNSFAISGTVTAPATGTATISAVPPTTTPAASLCPTTVSSAWADASSFGGVFSVGVGPCVSSSAPVASAAPASGGTGGRASGSAGASASGGTNTTANTDTSAARASGGAGVWAWMALGIAAAAAVV